MSGETIPLAHYEEAAKISDEARDGWSAGARPAAALVFEVGRRVAYDSVELEAWARRQHREHTAA